MVGLLCKCDVINLSQGIGENEEGEKPRAKPARETKDTKQNGLKGSSQNVIIKHLTNNGHINKMMSFPANPI